MLSLAEWMRIPGWTDRPWLLVGKGPSFARHAGLDLTPFYRMSLNHAVRELAVDVAHFIDLDAVAASADSIRQNAGWLLVPRYPHIDFRPSKEPLEHHVDEVPVLREFARRGRLVWYYHDRPWYEDPRLPRPADGGPVIAVHYFSAEAAVGILAAMGVRTVRTLGIDGGRQYSNRFQDLNRSTCLANGQPSFDNQFLPLHRVVKETAMDFGPLVEPIRVYVGTDDSQMVGLRVLEHSIRKFASRPVEVVPLLNLPVPMPRDPSNRPRTGFSFARFLIPQLAGYRGRGIYLDADMLVFSDIAEMWDLPMGECRVLCTRQDAPPPTWKNNDHFQPGRQLSVMLLDCGRLDWRIEDIVRGLDEGRYTYKQLMYDLCVLPPEQIGEHMPPVWNSLECFEPNRTCLLHMTDMAMQPWRYNHNPLRSVWRAFYREAVEAGAVEPELVEKGIAAGDLLPELAGDLKRAPSRTGVAARKQTPLDGVAARHWREQELERMALRVEVELQREALTRAEVQIADLAAQNTRLRSPAWLLRRAVTKPFQALKNVLKR